MHTVGVTVRFRDTDMFGHVNNAVYLSYLEDARLQLMEDLGFEVIPLILASVKADFRAQAFFRQKLAIETAVVRIGNSSFDLFSSIKDTETGQVVFEATSTIVHFNYETQKSERIPDSFRQKLEQHISPQQN